MRILFVFAVLLLGCGHSDNELMEGRWSFSGADIKQLKQIANEYTRYDVDGFRQIFAGSKFIIRKDGTFDLCLFQDYNHGTWKKVNEQLILSVEPSSDPVVFNIDTLSLEWMQLSIDTNNLNKLSTLVMSPPFGKVKKERQTVRFRFRLDDENYNTTAKDPYSKENNWWRIKPLKLESEEELHKRLLNLVDFHLAMFEDALERDRKVITYNWFSSPLIVANNGLGLDHYTKIRNKWQQCFYDSLQARQAYKILNDGFNKPLRFPEEIKNPFEKSIHILKQYRKHIH